MRVSRQPTEPIVGRLLKLCEALDSAGARVGEWFGGDPLAVLDQRIELLGLQAPASPSVSFGGKARMVRCFDGWAAVSLPRPEDVEAVAAWLELGHSTAADHDPWPVVVQGCASRSTAEVIERAALLGLAVSAVGERCEDTQAVLAERVGEAPAIEPANLVVANLGSLWAAPLAAQMLRRMGARVITVESTERPDGARATPRFFQALHEGTEFVSMPFGTPAGRRSLAELLQSVDVVIEGSRPRALQQLGIDARQMVEHGPRLWVSITAHGRSEPWANRAGFGDDAAAAGGLVRWVDGSPAFVADAIADPLSGLTAAEAIATLASGGDRWIVDIALARVAASFAA